MCSGKIQIAPQQLIWALWVKQLVKTSINRMNKSAKTNN